MVAKMVTNLRFAFSKQSFSKVISRSISFESFCLDGRLIKRLKNLGIVSTTDIQEKVRTILKLFPLGSDNSQQQQQQYLFVFSWCYIMYKLLYSKININNC